MKLDRKLRMGLIGGGPGAFIGEVHRKASRLDGEIELVAGAFDIDPQEVQGHGQDIWPWTQTASTATTRR